MQIESHVANNIAITVGITSTPIVPDNSARKGIVIVNDGANVVYLTLSTLAATTPAVAGQGIRLNPGGGSTQLDLNSMWKGAINGIAVGGASNVTVCELL